MEIYLTLIQVISKNFVSVHLVYYHLSVAINSVHNVVALL